MQIQRGEHAMDAGVVADRALCQVLRVGAVGQQVVECEAVRRERHVEQQHAAVPVLAPPPRCQLPVHPLDLALQIRKVRGTDDHNVRVTRAFLRVDADPVAEQTGGDSLPPVRTRRQGEDMAGERVERTLMAVPRQPAGHAARTRCRVVP
ncbi:hypothetical protein CGL27_10545 [Streptomyces sp. 11-1-2]|nr:hypothetical protein CGL27_10545 [Streptomyces sp. 11-1-2]